MRPFWGNRAFFCTGLLFWASRLVSVKTEYSLSFWPQQLSRAEGENATFFCKVSHKSPGPILNWYREKNGSQPEKLAAYPKDTPSSHLQERYHIAMCDYHQTYKMTILGLQLNDSGRYFCGIINFEMPPVEESNRSELSVTERIVVSTTTPPVTAPVRPEKFPWIVVMVSVVVGTVVVLLLLSWILSVDSRGRGGGLPLAAPGLVSGPKGAGNSESDKNSLTLKKPDPSDASTPTVVYGQLDFQRTEVPKQGGDHSCEQTEYATIVFPAEKPAFYGSSPHRK